ncbi:doublesex- and mab-3-related transcription factor B1-like [Chaetodon trifascialis]|uniref:doublesex- and mab-3-related transcription factor B1-like n=1 Tax=Chaetodon trifascialis TaxID=109706 RepID=UPI003994075A
MSLSKAAGRPREPKCSRCRHHGVIVPLKGHMQYCPFLRCNCWRCYLNTQRTRTTALMRSLRKGQDKEQRPCAHTGVIVVKQAAEGSTSTPAADGDAHQAATSGPMIPPTEDGPVRDVFTAQRPLDVRKRPAAGGEAVPALDSGKAMLSASNAPYFGTFGRTPPLPVIHVPFRVSGHPPSSYTPCPSLLLDMPWFPPAGFYNNGFCRPLMLPHLHAGAAYHQPLPEPPPRADCRKVFITLQPLPLPEPVQQEWTSVQYLQPPPPTTDLTDLD